MSNWQRFKEWMNSGHPPLWAWCITWAIEFAGIAVLLFGLVLSMLQ